MRVQDDRRLGDGQRITSRDRRPACRNRGGLSSPRPGETAAGAAVFLLARSATVDRVIDAIKPFNPTVIQTNLTKDREEELVAALQG